MNKVYYSFKQLNSEQLLFEELSFHAKTQKSVCAWNLLYDKFYAVFNQKLSGVEFLKSGKPICKTAYISISHSDSLVAIAFSKDTETAIDIELIKQNIPEKVARFIGKTESVGEFYSGWTEREAVIKAKNYPALKKSAEMEFCGITKTVTVNEKAFSLSIYGENAEFIEI